MSPKNAVYAEFTRLSVMFPVISAQKSACAEEITIPSINATQNDMMCACAVRFGSHRGQGAAPLGVSACRVRSVPETQILVLIWEPLSIAYCCYGGLSLSPNNT